MLARVSTPSSPVRERERERERERDKEREGETERERGRIVQNCYFYFKRNDGCLAPFSYLAYYNYYIIIENIL